MCLVRAGPPGLSQKKALLDATVGTQAIRHMGPSLTLLVHDNMRQCQRDITLHPLILFTGFPGGSDAGDSRGSGLTPGSR